MAKLAELANDYAEAVVRLRIAIEELEQRKEELDEHGQKVAEHDLRQMRQMLRETREVGEVVRHYYDRAYWRNQKYTL